MNSSSYVNATDDTKPVKTYYNKGRIEAFSDGVFAIAITILVFDLKLPDGLSESDFYDALVKLGPKLASFLLSFALIGTYWVAQHHLLNYYVRQGDKNLVWLNNTLLLGVVLVPFLAGLLGSYGAYYGAVVLYGANLVFIGLMLLAMAAYVRRTPDIRVEPLNFYTLGFFRLRARVAITIYILAILVAFINPSISVWIYFVVPVIFIGPFGLEKLWAKSYKAGRVRREKNHHSVREE